MLLRKITALIIGIAVAGACGAEGREPGTACGVGSQMGCACGGGRLGVQTCLPDGSGYGACVDCRDPRDAGAD